MVIVGLQAKPPEVDLFDAALREVELSTTVAHICDSNLPESLSVLAATDLAPQVLDRVVDIKRVVEDALRRLTASYAPATMYR